MPIAAVPVIASVASALNAHLGGVTLSALPSVAQSSSPGVSLQDTQVAQYSKNVYTAVLNGIAANNGGGAAGEIAHLNLVGPFGAPPPPAGSAAGAPYAPGANHNDYAAQVMQSLRSLAGNGKLFQK